MTFVFYGSNGNYMECTAKARELIKDGKLIIPRDDHVRASLFTDPYPGILKDIKIIRNGEIFIIPHDMDFILECDPHECKSTYEVLLELHSKIKLETGSMSDEFPEQVMSLLFIKKNSKVLELGSNIGRNSLIIASLLENDENMVTVESNPEYIPILTKHRDMNGYKFKIVNAAVSKIPLIQTGWVTSSYLGELPPGYFFVNTISYKELKEKYNIVFDTLVIDCEGAFYYILRNEPEILENINTIISENDYSDVSHRRYVATQLINNGFKCVYSMNLGDGISDYDKGFYEVWKKT